MFFKKCIHKGGVTRRGTWQMPGVLTYKGLDDLKINFFFHLIKKSSFIIERLLLKTYYFLTHCEANYLKKLGITL